MDRILVAHTPIGETWWASGLQGTEEISTLYEYRLELKSNKSDIDMQSLIGEVCSVACKNNVSLVRHLSGYVVSAVAKGKMDEEHWFYELIIVPKLWYASHRADFKIFQNQTVQTIADEVLQQNAINYEWRLKNSYKSWEYVVQYGETDLAFLLRLLGHEGIYFWFEHGQSGEKLILGDHFSVHEPFAGYATIPYYPPAADSSRVDEEHFHAWHARRVAEPGKFVHTSYDFKNPDMDLKTECNEPCGHLFDQYEIFAYPGTYYEPERQHGQDYATARLHGRQIAQDVIVLEGTVRGVIPGCSFTLTKHPVEGQNREFLITRVDYLAKNNDIRSEGTQTEEAIFHTTVSAIPINRQYRTPSEKYRMPRTHGPDTAVVVGPPGSEIHTDTYGRVRVHFHWDRYGQKDGEDSCWIRVASPWAGSNFGGMHIPRVGQEVIINYEHGDPQRPIITGRVYNAQQMPPWDLPANKTQSGILTRSSPGGSPSNANALRFEDAKGQEEVWLNAEKDQRIEVGNDEKHSVVHNRNKSVGTDETTSVGNNRTETVGANESITIGAAQTVTVTASQDVIVGAGQTFTITGDQSFAVTGNNHYGATGSTTLVSGTTFDAGSADDMTLVSGTKITNKVAGSETVIKSALIEHAVNKSGSVKITPGSVTHKVNSTKTEITSSSIVHETGSSASTVKSSSIVHESGGSRIEIRDGSIVLIAGGSTVKLDSGGVSLNGAKIFLNC